MNVTLAYAYEGHAPDETIDVPRGTAKRLIADGLARAYVPADPEIEPVPGPDVEQDPDPVEKATPPPKSGTRRDSRKETH